MASFSRFNGKPVEGSYGGAARRQLRQQAGLTQTELSRRAKVKQASISAYETNRWQPSPESTKRLAAVLGVDWKMLYATFDQKSEWRMPKNRDSFGNKVKAARITAGLSRQELATRINCGALSIKRLEECAKIPKLTVTVFALANFSNCLYQQLTLD